METVGSVSIGTHGRSKNISIVIFTSTHTGFSTGRYDYEDR